MFKKFLYSIFIFFSLAVDLKCGQAFFVNTFNIRTENLALYQVLNVAKAIISRSEDTEETREALAHVNEEISLFREIIAEFNKGNSPYIHSRFIAVCNFFKNHEYPEPRHLRTFAKKVEKVNKFVQKYYSERHGMLSEDEVKLRDKLLEFNEILVSRFLDYKYFEVDLFDRIADWTIYKPIELMKEHPTISAAVIITLVTLISIKGYYMYQEHLKSVAARAHSFGLDGDDDEDNGSFDPARGKNGSKFKGEIKFEKATHDKADGYFVGMAEVKDASLENYGQVVYRYNNVNVPHQQGGGSCGVNAVFNAANIGDDGQISREDEEKRKQRFKCWAARHKAYELVGLEERILGKRYDFAAKNERLKAYEAAILAGNVAADFFAVQKQQINQQLQALDNIPAAKPEPKPEIKPGPNPESQGWWGKFLNMLRGSSTSKKAEPYAPKPVDIAAKKHSLEQKLQAIEALSEKVIIHNPSNQKKAEDILDWLEGGQLKAINQEFANVYVESDLARFSLSLASRKEAINLVKAAICSVIQPDAAKKNVIKGDRNVFEAIQHYLVTREIVYPSSGWNLCASVWVLILRKIDENALEWQAIKDDEKAVLEKMTIDVFSNKDVLTDLINAQAADIANCNPVEAQGSSLAKLRVDFWHGNGGDVRIIVPMREKGGKVEAEVMTHWLGYRLIRNGDDINIFCADSMGWDESEADCTKLIKRFFSQKPNAKEILQVKIALKNEEIARAQSEGMDAVGLQQELGELQLQLLTTQE